jgi:hypothetical protein
VGVLVRSGGGVDLGGGVGEPAGEQGGGGVGAAGVHAAGVVFAAAQGQAGEPLVAGLGVGGGHECPQRGHAVGFLADRHPPLAGAAGGAFGVGGDHGPAQGGLEPAEGLLRRAIEDPLLHGPRGVGVQVVGGVADRGDATFVEPAPFPQLPGFGQHLLQLHARPRRAFALSRAHLAW